jgi:hypothetical protein
MPVQDCQVNGRPGKKWGKDGKCFTGPNAHANAARQGKAIKAAQVRRRRGEK